MKIAVIGSRNLTVDDFDGYIPEGISEIISGGAKGVDSCIEKYAELKGIKFTVFYPNYEKYGKNAPLKRNMQIIEYADHVIAFWDGKSRGTKFVIDNCKKMNKGITVYLME